MAGGATGAAAAGYAAHLAATGLVESTRLLDVWPWLVVRVPPPALPVAGCFGRDSPALHRLPDVAGEISCR